MANLDSLSFALLIPFAICFLLVFLVCCFADQIKEIFRMPSQLPAYYLTARTPGTDILSTSQSHRRHRPRRSRRQQSGRGSNAEETRVLILNEEGRSRNDSETSEESNTGQTLQEATVNRDRARMNTGVIICPQIIISNGSFVHLPQTSIPTNYIPAPHTITRSREGIFGRRELKKSSSDMNDATNTSISAHVRKHSRSGFDFTHGNINRNRSVPSFLTQERQIRDNSSRSFRNLPSVIPLGLELKCDKKV